MWHFLLVDLPLLLGLVSAIGVIVWLVMVQPDAVTAMLDHDLARQAECRCDQAEHHLDVARGTIERLKRENEALAFELSDTRNKLNHIRTIIFDALRYPSPVNPPVEQEPLPMGDA